MLNEVEERYKFINNISIGDTFNREQLMAIFKISGQSGMMKTNLLNALVLTTSLYNGVYGDTDINEGKLIYTGEGLVGDQSITKNNKTLYYSKENNIPVYLFSKDKNRRYTFEGKVELDGEPYQIEEKDRNGDLRRVYKFPLRIIYTDNNIVDKQTLEVTHDIVEISKKINENDYKNIKMDNSSLEIRRYRKKDVLNKKNRSSKPDYIADEIIKSKQGEITEKAIFEKEIEKMMELELIEEINKMENFFNNKKENEGYDILSFEKKNNGEIVEKYIEVKSTKAGESTPIDITDNEIEFAKSHIDQYYLYRIYFDSGESMYKYKIVPGKELFENYDFIPTTYKIYSK